ncbi:unnamed protein product [Pedinophyceae sp. YPF-701]|nr:unnamed protein product [Pedinophyceae sp. YPF-701]
MYDFCFSYPYALILAGGGAAGYFLAGSTISLQSGLAAAVLILALTTWSWRSFKNGRKNKVAIVLEALIACGLWVDLAKRYTQTHQYLPTGALALLNGAMFAAYLWCLTLGPTPKAKKQA